jgi:hypothetical protein
MKLKALAIGSAVIVGFVAFQNCSKVAFTPTPDGNVTANAIVPTPTPGPNPTPTPYVDPRPSCQKFVTLTASDGQLLDIPALTSDGICYIVKLISKSDYDPSSKNPKSDIEVVSRDHDKSVSDSNITHHPYALGSKTLRLTFNDQRALRLSGAANDTASILVDNFILVGISLSTMKGTPSYYKAYGTKDSCVNGNDHVLFQNVAIPLTAFATGGTSTIRPLDLEGVTELKKEYTLDVRALDAGSVGHNSDIYLLIK